MADYSLNRIRILKTGLFGVDRYIDMSVPENILYFEKLAEPGTRLKLRRIKDYPTDPFRIEVYAPDDRFLGRVTIGKNETAARLMDAGLILEAIVNKSLPVHGSDSPLEAANIPGTVDSGWDEASRIAKGYDNCNLPFCIYLIDD